MNRWVLLSNRPGLYPVLAITHISVCYGLFLPSLLPQPQYLYQCELQLSRAVPQIPVPDWPQEQFLHISVGTAAQIDMASP